MGHGGTIDEGVKMCIGTTTRTDIIQVSFREAHLKPSKTMQANNIACMKVHHIYVSLCHNNFQFSLFGTNLEFLHLFI